MLQCLFCDSTDLTDEHIWPDWIVREFKKLVPPTRGRFTARRTRDRGTVNTWPSDTITHKKKLVCEPCNTVWMSQIETCAAPILRLLFKNANTPRQLTLDDQCALAVWVTLRSMVFDALSPDKAGLYYTALERARFASSDPFDPPANTHIWLAPYFGQKYRAMFNCITKINIAKDHGLHVDTCVLNQMAIQLITWKGQEDLIDLAALTQAGWDEATRRVWPSPRRVINWPPPQHLSNEGLDAFLRRFRPPN